MLKLVIQHLYCMFCCFEDRVWWTCPPRLRDDEDWNAFERKKDQEDAVAQYDLCSGSLITNKGSHKMEESTKLKY